MWFGKVKSMQEPVKFSTHLSENRLKKQSQIDRKYGCLLSLIFTAKQSFNTQLYQRIKMNNTLVFKTMLGNKKLVIETHELVFFLLNRDCS